jgi:two-component system chemotaxis sensor kinase CheA
VDHGIELRSERIEAGKPEQGTLELTTSVEAGVFSITIEDDGRGIGWEAIRERARSAALPNASPDDLVEALFADGISTSSHVSDISGRGVGMGAMRAECRARGGRMEVSSLPGAGTRIVFKFPESAMCAPDTAHAA